MTEHVNIATAAIKEKLETGFTHDTEKLNVSDEFSVKSACFVTLKKQNGDLRGCIGTIKPVYKNLKTEIIRNAVSSALSDTRFSPLKLKELSSLIISVEVLSEPEKVLSINELDPKIYGIILTGNSFERGVLLPDIEGIETIEQQIKICKRKAGIIGENYKIQRFTTQKFY